ncbi:MAG: type II toxin-antitoxin system Phd/YefM family antitoxin [bacterium]
MDKTTIPISEARKNIFKIVKDAQKGGRYYTLTERGYPKAVIVSAEEFEAWQETQEVMQEFPEIEQDIKKIDCDVKSGKYKKYPTLEEAMKRHTSILANKREIKYEISNQAYNEGRKRPFKNSFLS